MNPKEVPVAPSLLRQEEETAPRTQHQQDDEAKKHDNDCPQKMIRYPELFSPSPPSRRKKSVTIDDTTGLKLHPCRISSQGPTSLIVSMGGDDNEEEVSCSEISLDEEEWIHFIDHDNSERSSESQLASALFDKVSSSKQQGEEKCSDSEEEEVVVVVEQVFSSSGSQDTDDDVGQESKAASSAMNNDNIKPGWNIQIDMTPTLKLKRSKSDFGILERTQEQQNDDVETGRRNNKRHFSSSSSYLSLSKRFSISDSSSRSVMSNTSLRSTNTKKSTTTRSSLSIHDELAPLKRDMTMKRSLRSTGSLVAYYASNWEQATLNSKSNAWIEYLFYTVMALAIQLILGWSYAFPDGNEPTTCMFVEGGRSIKNSLMCDLEKTLDHANLMFRVLVAFILGGFITNTVYLWRVRRTAYCALCGATRNLILQLATLLPYEDADNDDDDIVIIRQTIERWAILGYELSVLKARGQCDTLEGKAYLESKGLLSDNEWDRMVEGDRHTTVWFWIQLQAVKLSDSSTISELRLQTICNSITLIRDKANDLMSCIDRDQPVAYTSVVGLLVNLSLLLTALWKGVLWAIWFYETNGLIWATPKMYMDVLATMGFNAIFAMLFDISSVLYNPFGTRDGVDIPHDVVSDGVRNLAKRLGKMDRCEPGTMITTSTTAATTTITTGNDNNNNNNKRLGSSSSSKLLKRSLTSMASIADLSKNIEFETMQVYGGRRHRKGGGGMGLVGNWFHNNHNNQDGGHTHENCLDVKIREMEKVCKG